MRSVSLHNVCEPCLASDVILLARLGILRGREVLRVTLPGTTARPKRVEMPQHHLVWTF